MKTTKVRFTACISLILMSMMLTGISYAKIDPNSVVGMWLFDSKDELAVDSSGNEHHGEILGDIKKVNGQFGQALEFPGGSGNYVRVPHEEALNLTTFSFTLWLQVPKDVADGYVAVLTKTPDDTIENYSGYIDTQGQRIFWGRFTSGGNAKWVQSLAGKTSLADGKWHHLAVTYDMKFLRTYVDGVVEIEVESSKEPDTVDGPLYLGTDKWEPNILRGLMDDVSLFNVGLTEDEIQAIMERGLEGASAVSNVGKLTTTWSRLKSQ